MTALTILSADQVPMLYAPDAKAALRSFEFFTVHIRNLNTRAAYAQAASDFANWCQGRGIPELRAVQPVHVAAYIEGLTVAPPTVKLRLAALRSLFDWLVVGQVIPHNPAAAVRGPRHSVKKGKTPVLAADEARALFDSIDPSSVVGLRDRALIAAMVYTFGRVSAVVGMRVEDVYIQNRRTWLRLHEKGGKQHEMPAHHALDDYLHAYMEAAGLKDGKAPLFQSADWHGGKLTGTAMGRTDAYRMIRRRAGAAKLLTKIGCHSFRATGITEYLRNGGKLEVAQQMANHESSRTTGLYDRRGDQVSLAEVERIVI